MAVFNERFYIYLKIIFKNTLDNNKPAWENDLLASRLINPDKSAHFSFLSGKQCAKISSTNNILTALSITFPKGILHQNIDKETERRIIVLKKGFPKMPATTNASIIKGTGKDIDEQVVLNVYASHGLSHTMKEFTNVWNFTEINRRADGLAQALSDLDGNIAQNLKMRWDAILKWQKAPRGKREQILAGLPLSRSLFFHWWNNFVHIGILGLTDFGKEILRPSKIKPPNEAQIVIDRLQHPKRADSFYVQRLSSKGIEVKRGTITKIFKRWEIRNFNSVFISNLKRLELPYDDKEEFPSQRTSNPIRKVDENFLYQLAGMKNYSIPISAPGLYALWIYIEELGLFPFLDNLGLTKYANRQKYSCFDLLMFEIARRFYGIETSSAACELQCMDIALFANLYKPPCNDTLLNGLRNISEKQVFQIRRWLVERLAQLGLSTGKYLSFDFHHIDQDVQLPELRNFGKGPSPKKKVCATGFRPHIAWDVGDDTLLVAEFRKASARGTTTVKRFAGDYILPTFRGLFDTVYLDSEYTGKDVWNFVLNEKNGMGAHLTACLKQNPMVKKERDQFLSRHTGCANFWKYYDNDHVYTDKTFVIEWEYTPKNTKEKQILKLTCVVKKHVTTGRLRCFGSSKNNLSAKQILTDYSSRWIIENGIKDLIAGYFLDKCPGTDPHLVDVHFLIVTICKILFRMIERDLKQHLANPDGSIKTLSRMRDLLFRTGAASIKVQNDDFLIQYANSFSISITTTLKEWHKLLKTKQGKGLEVLGGMRLDFDMQVPVGSERRNSGKKVSISDLKNFEPTC